MSCVCWPEFRYDRAAVRAWVGGSASLAPLKSGDPPSDLLWPFGPHKRPDTALYGCPALDAVVTADQ